MTKHIFMSALTLSHSIKFSKLEDKLFLSEKKTALHSAPLEYNSHLLYTLYTMERTKITHFNLRPNEQILETLFCRLVVSDDGFKNKTPKHKKLIEDKRLCQIYDELFSFSFQATI